ncbi:MAG: phosphoribosyltransferase [Gammaproteobacteria bacterium]
MAISELVALRDRAPVFRNRTHAGQVLAQMLEPAFGDSGAIVLAIPAGGVPVAAEIAQRLTLPFDIAVVSKILLPWTTESGFGAVAFEGSVWINSSAIANFGLSKEDVERSTAAARKKVSRRVKRLRGDRPMPPLAQRIAIVVDDGIAAGSTLRTAIAALRKCGATRVVATVPTGHDRSVELIGALADEVYCANVRGGFRFAVADAYEVWTDVSEDEVAAILGTFGAR